MKKLDVISFIAIAISLTALALLSVTGMIAHIIISVLALCVLVVCTILQFKTWKYKVLEILYRLFYFLTLVNGLVMILAHIGGVVFISHLVTASLFAAIYLVNFLLKLKK